MMPSSFKLRIHPKPGVFNLSVRRGLLQLEQLVLIDYGALRLLAGTLAVDRKLISTDRISNKPPREMRGGPKRRLDRLLHEPPQL
jgi:hypothetical protein